MSGNATARQIVHDLLQGVAPPRPLFLPIVFAHGARIESVPLRIFLSNPTKIANATRQLRARLRSDGVTCYFDPFLEAEALGATLEWDADGQQADALWQQNDSSLFDEAVFDDPARRGRVGIAIEAVRRLKTTMREDCLLAAAVAGPFAMASLLAHLSGHAPDWQQISVDSLDLAAALISPMAKAFVEAGANVIFIREQLLPALSAEDCAAWAARVSTAVNIVRFYEALPVLLLADSESVAMNRDAILQQSWDCVVCPAAAGLGESPGGQIGGWDSSRFGIALPPNVFQAGPSASVAGLTATIRGLRPCVVTTAGDLPLALDIQRLNEVWENIRRFD